MRVKYMRERNNLLPENTYLEILCVLQIPHDVCDKVIVIHKYYSEKKCFACIIFFRAKVESSYN